MFLFALFIIFLVAAACGYSFRFWRAFIVLVCLLLVALAAFVAALGQEFLLVAAFGGGPVIVVGLFGLLVGAKFRPADAAG
jgi:hypothetical protein